LTLQLVKEDNTRYDEFKPAENIWGTDMQKFRAVKQSDKRTSKTLCSKMKKMRKIIEMYQGKPDIHLI